MTLLIEHALDMLGTKLLLALLLVRYQIFKQDHVVTEGALANRLLVRSDVLVVDQVLARAERGFSYGSSRHIVYVADIVTLPRGIFFFLNGVDIVQDQNVPGWCRILPLFIHRQSFLVNCQPGMLLLGCRSSLAVGRWLQFKRFGGDFWDWVQ